MFSETRYALNGDLRVAYRASREGPRDIVFVPNWFTNCEVLPELPSIQGWVEAMTSLGSAHLLRPAGHGSVRSRHAGRAADLGAVGRQHHRGARRSRKSRSGPPRDRRRIRDGGAVRSDTSVAHHRAGRARRLRRCGRPHRVGRRRSPRCDGRHVGDGKLQPLLNPDMPWNEEIRATWARMERLAASPRTVALMFPLVIELDVRAILPTVRVPTLVVQHADDPFIPPAMGKYVADHIPGAKYVELPGRNLYHCVEPWRESFQEIAEFLTGEQADVADDRVLATVLFTDIVDSTRRAAEMGDRDWHALLDAHDAVVRSQLARFRGREVNTSGDGFLAMFDGPQRAIRCAMAIRDAVQALGIEVRAGLHTGECEVRGDDIGGIGVHIGARVSALAGRERRAGVEHAARPRDRVRTRVRGPRRSRAQGRARRVAALRRRLSVAVGFGETHFARRRTLLGPIHLGVRQLSDRTDIERLDRHFLTQSDILTARPPMPGRLVARRSF